MGETSVSSVTSGSNPKTRSDNEPEKIYILLQSPASSNGLNRPEFDFGFSFKEPQPSILSLITLPSCLPDGSLPLEHQHKG